jgi:hypothetical protein
MSASCHHCNQCFLPLEYPRVSNAEVISDRILSVVFTNQEVRDYDISKLLEKPRFAPLRQPVFFSRFTLEPGGYGIVWNDTIDLSEYELWKNGTLPHL